jgi:hypothetical protein
MHVNFGQRHASVATVLNDIDTSLKSLRLRVNEGFEKVGINFSNLIKMQQVTKEILINLCRKEFGVNMNLKQATEAMIYSNESKKQ